jgi:hypothetical protein
MKVDVPKPLKALAPAAMAVLAPAAAMAAEGTGRVSANDYHHDNENAASVLHCVLCSRTQNNL